MNLLLKAEKIIAEILGSLGYDKSEAVLETSSRKDLGDFQLNAAMVIAKKERKNPREVAQKIAEEISKKEDFFKNVNIAGPGFINISFTDEVLIDFCNTCLENQEELFNFPQKKKIFIDYGGANVAKTLHVGHLRSANIGEALKRLAKILGHEVISDVHFGDIGRQSGMVISELKKRFPEWVFFKKDYNGEYPASIPITSEDLGEIYPKASLAAKEDEKRMEEVQQITAELENGHKGYSALWNIIKKISIDDIKKIYERLNSSFELWEGESDSFTYLPETLEKMKASDAVRESEGALVVDVADEKDGFEMPPMILIKSNGATVYATREMATLYSRIKRFSPDEVWYVVDNRQDMYFKQVFRAVYKTKIVPENTNLRFIGFGTMNGADGKPFKTRSGGVMDLISLLNMVKEFSIKRLSDKVSNQDDREKISEMVSISALKYADLLPNRMTDYIFDLEKFMLPEGKTGPYILYSAMRINSLLRKAKESDESVGKVSCIFGEADREIILRLAILPKVLEKAFKFQSASDIAEYVYDLTSVYNTFYSNNGILKEKDEKQKESWLGISKIVYRINEKLIAVLGMEIPDRM